MVYQKVTVSLIMIGLLSLSFSNIQSAISSPSSAKARRDEAVARLRARAEAIKNKWKSRRDGDGGGGETGVGSWQPRICTFNCPPTSPDSSSFTSVNGQTQLLVQVHGFDLNTCAGSPNSVGAQINLPATQKGLVSLDKFVDSETFPNAVVVQVAAFDSNFNVVAIGSAPNSVSGTTQTYDLVNPLSYSGFGATTTTGTTIAHLLIIAHTDFFVTNTAAGTIRIANVRVNGVPLDKAIMQQADCNLLPGF